MFRCAILAIFLSCVYERGKFWSRYLELGKWERVTAHCCTATARTWDAANRTFPLRSHESTKKGTSVSPCSFKNARLWREPSTDLMPGKSVDGTGSVLSRKRKKRRDRPHGREPEVAMELDRHDDSGTRLDRCRTGKVVAKQNKWRQRRRPARKRSAKPYREVRTPSAIAISQEKNSTGGRSYGCLVTQCTGSMVYYARGASVFIYHRGCNSFFVHRVSCCGGVSYFAGRGLVAGAWQRPIV